MRHTNSMNPNKMGRFKIFDTKGTLRKPCALTLLTKKGDETRAVNWSNQK